jgi:hypothetical protein
MEIRTKVPACDDRQVKLSLFLTTYVPVPGLFCTVATDTLPVNLPEREAHSLSSVYTFIYALYSSPNIIRVIKSRRLRWAGHVARMGERRGAYWALVGKPEGRRPLERPRRRWKDNFKMDLREVGWGE